MADAVCAARLLLSSRQVPEVVSSSVESSLRAVPLSFSSEETPREPEVPESAGSLASRQPDRATKDKLSFGSTKFCL